MNCEDKENTQMQQKYVPPHLRRKPLNANAPAFVCNPSTLADKPSMEKLAKSETLPLGEIHSNMINGSHISPLTDGWQTVSKKSSRRIDTSQIKTPTKSRSDSAARMTPQKSPHSISQKISQKSSQEPSHKTPQKTPQKGLFNNFQSTPQKTPRRSSAEKYAKSPSSGKSPCNMTPKSQKAADTNDDDYDISKDTIDNTGPFIHDAIAFEMLQHAVFSNGNTVASQNTNICSIENSPVDFDKEIEKLYNVLGSDERENPLPWFQRLKCLAEVCKVTVNEDTTAAQLIGSILVYHVQNVIQFNWKYERKINKICKMMIAFLSDIVSRNLSYDWNKELMSQILLARLVYSRQLGNKWIRRMWRATSVTIQDILLVNERRNTVYALFNYKTKKLYINCVAGGSLLDAFEWIAIQTQNRIRMGNLNDVIITPFKSPLSIIDSPGDVLSEPVKSFDITQELHSPCKAAISEYNTPAKDSLENFDSPQSDFSSSPASIQTPQTPQSPQTPQDPFGYIAKIGLQHWIIMPLDTLTEVDSEYIEHRTKQRVHECRHRVIDNSIFFQKLKKPAKKMSSKRFERFVELRKRQKQRRQKEAQEKSSTLYNDKNQAMEVVEEALVIPMNNHIRESTDKMKVFEEQKSEVIVEKTEVVLANPIGKTTKLDCNIARLKISIPGVDEFDKENTPTTPSVNGTNKQLMSPSRAALGPLSSVLVSNRQNRVDF